MPKYRVEHDRENCIGCAACASVCPKHWSMNADGKSDLHEGTKRDSDGWIVKDFEEGEYNDLKQSADVCPVNVIHIVDVTNNKKII
ncbi:MAG: ferredoxin [Candidatus Micrarchaeota archaeon]|nr:ferredoxin [Candidatus Micrarchaeota archaeon]